MLSLLTALFAVLALALQASPAASPKVVFLKGQVLVVASADGTNARELVNDAELKGRPKWSPDGTRIAYTVAGNQSSNPKSHAILVVVDLQGRRVARVPVLSTEADGTPVQGMRGVEEAGWYSASMLFAEGSVSPYAAEYAVFDLSGKDVQGYMGTSFSTCAARGEAAYAGYLIDTDKNRAWVEINGTKIYTVERAGTVIHDVLWSQHCDRLLLLEVRDDTIWTLVVLRNRTVEARVPLPANVGYATPQQAGDSFLLTGASRPLVYGLDTRTLEPGESAVQEIDRRRAIIEQLGGREPDWWRP